MEAVGILHCELTGTNQAATRTGFIAELGLDLIDHEGILRVALRGIAGQLHGSLFVGHAQHHVNTIAVLEAEQF